MKLIVIVICNTRRNVWTVNNFSCKALLKIFFLFIYHIGTILHDRYYITRLCEDILMQLKTIQLNHKNHSITEQIKILHYLHIFSKLFWENKPYDLILTSYLTRRFVFIKISDMQSKKFNASNFPHIIVFASLKYCNNLDHLLLLANYISISKNMRRTLYFIHLIQIATVSNEPLFFK